MNALPHKLPSAWAKNASPAEQMLASEVRHVLDDDQRERLNYAAALSNGTWAQRAEAATLVEEVKGELAAGVEESQALEIYRLDMERGNALGLVDASAVEASAARAAIAAEHRASLPSPTNQGETRGQVRMKSRDGLAMLFDSGALTGVDGSGAPIGNLAMLGGPRSKLLKARTPDDWARAAVRLQAGLTYRDAFDETSGDLGSTLGNDGATISRRHKDYAAMRFDGVAKSVYDQQGRDRLERRVGLLNRLEIETLRAVAGQGTTLATICGVSSTMRTYRICALVRALDVVAEALRVPGHALLTGG